MTPINSKPAHHNLSSIESNNTGFGAAISTSFATVAMTAFLWSQIVSGLVQPII